MQFNRDASGKLTPLPKPSIDTGLGLERMVSILQEVPTNFETDLILPIIRKAEDLSEIAFGKSIESDVAMKVIADHSRAAAFLIGDGVLPSNDGRGYVLRRIMRRAIRYGRNIGLTRPFLHDTAAVVFDIMKPAYPELSDAKAFITNVIKNEEMRFSQTLDKGLKLLTETLTEMKAEQRAEVPGDVVFKLYDTYGFPVDIVRDVVRDEKITVDMEGFDREMAQQRERSRTVTTFSEISDAYKNFSARGIQPEFLGYDQRSAEAEVLLVVTGGIEVAEAGQGAEVEVVTDRTPFYGEAGGQAGDIGTLTGPDVAVDVSDTVKDPTGLIIHKGKIRSGIIRKGDTVDLKVDAAARGATALNHTATHILHAALRKVLGDHVKQAGSHVAPDRLRFDFTHFSQVKTEELERIESMVNDRIRENVPVNTEVLDAEDAFKSGATALFEEKYGDRVRVVSLAGFSKELCGGTHTRATGDIGAFRIIGESSIASGVRRIEALTGAAAVAFNLQQAGIVRQAALLVKDHPAHLVDKIETMLSGMKALEREVQQLKAKLAQNQAGEADDDLLSVKGVDLLVKRVAVDSTAGLRDLADRFKDKIRSGIVVLGSVSGEKVLLIAVVTKDLLDRFHAGNIVKQIAPLVGGGGGGRPDMAQAGGTQPEKLDAALEAVPEIIEGA